MSRRMKPREPGSVFDMLDAAIEEIGTKGGHPARGAEMAGAFLGQTKWTILHKIDPDDTKHRLSATELEQLARHYRLHAVAHHFAALAEGVFIPLVHANDPRWDRLSAKAFEDMGRFGAELFRDLADGTIDPAEARRALPLAQEMQRHFAQMVGMLMTTIEDGAVPQVAERAARAAEIDEAAE